MIDVFVAHDDIEGGDEWMNALSNEIQNCDIFLILLSDRYHKANFTDHETGIAYFLQKPIIPISIDRTIPYGFMSKYQAWKVINGLNKGEIRQLAQTIYFKVAGPHVVDYLTDMYAKVESFDQANKMVYLLSDYRESLSRDNINTLAAAFISNRQIQDGFTARSVMIGLFKEHESHLTAENKECLREFLAT